MLIRIRNRFQFDLGASCLLEIFNDLLRNLVRILSDPHRQLDTIKLGRGLRPISSCRGIRIIGTCRGRIATSGKSHGKCCDCSKSSHSALLCEHHLRFHLSLTVNITALLLVRCYSASLHGTRAVYFCTWRPFKRISKVLDTYSSVGQETCSIASSLVHDVFHSSNS